MITPKKILACIAKKYDLDVKDIEGPSRVREIAESRHLYCLLMREKTRMSYQSIGKYINRDHCTVLLAIKRANELMSVYPELKSLYNEIKDEISME